MALGALYLEPGDLRCSLKHIEFTYIFLLSMKSQSRKFIVQVHNTTCLKYSF